MEKFDFKKIEDKWQKRWEKEKVFVAKDNSKKKKYYVLEMFPYPSADGLHMGHALNFTINDIFARFRRMQGFNVMYPIGYDSLGLPAENAAIKAGTHPKKYTDNSIKNFMKQQRELGFSYDKTRFINTADSSYYKWDQWIFLKLFEKGLAYRKKAAVNWCPSCATVLANEQAQTGNCDRCKSRVEIKHLTQWFFKTTEYADELVECLKNMDWPERTKTMQRNWIGKSHGVEIDFEINNEKWSVFTTRADTIFGVTFMVVSAQHEKLLDLVTSEQKKEVEKFLKKLNNVSEKDFADMEKEGVFTGSYAVNPSNGKKVPIYAGNFVLADYGSGMVMAVPAHDKRDYEFAKKYGLEIKEVVGGGDIKKEAYVGEGELLNSGEFDSMNNREAIEKITDWLFKKGNGRKVVNFKLRDWGISRQRYWGTPIPIVNCDKCGIVPVSEKDLPIKLPKEVKFGKGNPLETNEKWIKTKCPKCGGKARRETDTMDTFVNSSWYFMRYCDPNNKKKIFDKSKVKYWCPVDLYVGGAEHACMHLIYSRFYVKFLRDLGLINFDEPAKKLFHQGMLHASDGNKMSKSLGNVINPLDVIEKYSADSLRFALMSFAAPDKDTDWDEKVLIGSHKILNRVIEYFDNLELGKDSEKMIVKLNKAIKDITFFVEEMEYRKATIVIRQLWESIFEEKMSKKTLESGLKLLNLFCPHLTEELWEKLGNKDFISLSAWPTHNEGKLKIKTHEINLDEKIISYVKGIIEKVESKGEKVSKVYLYVMPFEVEEINSKIINDGIGRDVIIYSVKDKDKYDPENKSKKARPGGMPGIYFE